jgi:sialidase-1
MKTVLFRAGEGGYPFYRGAAMLALPENRIIIFSTGRTEMPEKNKPPYGDSGERHLYARISRDGGKSFGRPFLAAMDGPNTVACPCPVFDRQTGILWLFLCGNDGTTFEKEIIEKNGKRRVLLLHSKDLGETWSPIENMTEILSKKEWTWYSTGPGHGLQARSGRLILPCDHIVYPLDENDAGQSYFSHTVYSTDHGMTWHIGADLSPSTNECSLAEPRDGLLYMSARRFPGHGLRGFSYSEDYGASWTPIADTDLPDPACEASVTTGLTAGKDGFYPLYLTNPADPKTRRNLTLRISYDGGVTWPESRHIEEGFSAYSDSR